MKLLGMIIAMWVLFLPSFNIEEILDHSIENIHTVSPLIKCNKTKLVKDIHHLSDHEKVILLKLANETFIVSQQKIKDVKELTGKVENFQFTIKYNSQQGIFITDTQNISLPYETSNWLYVSSLYQEAKVFY